MKKHYTILFLFFSLFTFVKAQEINQISFGAGYETMAFYDIKSGELTSVPHTSWDIAFRVGLRDASVFVNEGVASSHGTPPVAVELYLSSAISFETADTTDLTRIYNNEVSWAEGAFNLVKAEDDAFDLGWGSYNSTNHSIVGTRIFIIKLRNGQFKKLMIDSLVGGIYTFKYADLNGANEQSHTINKADYTGKTLAYFSIENNSVLDLEPTSWDLVLTRYSTPIPDGTGNFLDYMVSGILSNDGVEVAQIDSVAPETITSNDYADNYTTQLDKIGYDWKSFDLDTYQWSTVMDRVYFVKTADQQLWKLWFIDFEGSSTGGITLQKTLIEDLSTNVEDYFENLQSFKVFPNPAQQTTQVAFELHTTHNEGVLTIINQLGQTFFESVISIHDGLNVKQLQFDLPSGFYQVSLQVKNARVLQPLIIK